MFNQKIKRIMKIYKEESLRDFEFWSGARDRAKYLTDDEFDRIEAELEYQYPDGMSETELNDLFWFDFDWVCSLIGESEDSVLSREDEE